jgi:hypothetical protein
MTSSGPPWILEALVRLAQATPEAAQFWCDAAPVLQGYDDMLAELKP